MLTPHYAVVHSRYGVDHVQTHLDATVGVVRPVLGQTAHTVITVSQQFDSQTRVFLSQSVEPIHKPPIEHININVCRFSYRIRILYGLLYNE